MIININSITNSLKSRSLWESVILGQAISLLICTTGVSSQILSTHFHIHMPTAQNFLNYLLLALFFNLCLYIKRRSIASSRYASYTKYYFFEVLRKRGLKYFLIALVDVQANYLIVKAYQYTTLTSIQLLDCLIIPIAMLLSIIFLRARYRASHFFGIFICIIGVGFLIYSDHQQRSNQDPDDFLPTNKFLGDMLCILAAVFYALSNVGQEFYVKRFDKYEFLAMIGAFGTLINGIQFLILERKELPIKLMRHLKSHAILLFLVFTIAMFCLYYIMAVAMGRSSAVAVNLSILSADFYTLFLGMFFFEYKFNALFLLAFVLIINGVIIYNLTPAHDSVRMANGLPNNTLSRPDGSDDRGLSHPASAIMDPNVGIDIESEMGGSASTVITNKPSTIVTPSDLAQGSGPILGIGSINVIEKSGSGESSSTPDGNEKRKIFSQRRENNGGSGLSSSSTPVSPENLVKVKNTENDFENVNFSVA